MLQLKGRYPQIRLILVLPCREQTRGWAAEDIRRYQAILQGADKIVYMAEHYYRGCMHRRNRHLVDCSSVCVAYCTRSTGGTAYAVAYAQKQGLTLIGLGKQ